MKGRWNEVKNQNGVLYTFNCPDRFSAPIKMALFDLDNTLIRYSKDIHELVGIGDSNETGLQLRFPFVRHSTAAFAAVCSGWMAGRRPHQPGGCCAETVYSGRYEGGCLFR